jgi:hypothetical protein
MKSRLFDEELVKDRIALDAASVNVIRSSFVPALIDRELIFGNPEIMLLGGGLWPARLVLTRGHPRRLAKANRRLKAPPSQTIFIGLRRSPGDLGDSNGARWLA